MRTKMAVIADGDVWELRLPLFWGSVGITVSRQFLPEKAINISRGPSVINACQALTDITEARLAYFSDVDLTEVGRQYSIGLEVREAFERFRPAHQKFIEAESDWATAVMLLTSQHPNFGPGESRLGLGGRVEVF